LFQTGLDGLPVVKKLNVLTALKRPALVGRSFAAACAAVVGATGAAATPQPFLRSVGASRGHVVAVFTRGDLAPGKIVVAVRPGTGRDGSFLRQNVRLKEPIARETPLRGGYRVRTRHTLRPGRYYVQVSGAVIGLDCTPVKPCPVRWSNIRRVAVRRGASGR
jgi:hypothetical protein